MKITKPKIIVIVGPTASGKSELAVRLAKLFNGEIISADSRQIYRGLDIGTGKVKGKWQIADAGDAKKMFVYRGIPHYCIDIVSPKKQFSAADFMRLAKEAIKEIQKRGKIPIIAGGTGFWIDALIYNMNLPAVLPNQELRALLAQKNTGELFSLLKKLDPRRASAIDPHNTRRLIRAIEIAGTIGISPKIKKQSSFNALWIGIATQPEKLKLKIKNRLKGRLREGLIQEAHMLHKKGLPWKRFYELGLEYRFLADFLQKMAVKKEMMEKLAYAIWHYAKRQMTWWRRNKKIQWVTSAKDAIRLTKTFLQNK